MRLGMPSHPGLVAYLDFVHERTCPARRSQHWCPFVHVVYNGRRLLDADPGIEPSPRRVRRSSWPRCDRGSADSRLCVSSDRCDHWGCHDISPRLDDNRRTGVLGVDSEPRDEAVGCARGTISSGPRPDFDECHSEAVRRSCPRAGERVDSGRISLEVMSRFPPGATTSSLLSTADRLGPSSPRGSEDWGWRLRTGCSSDLCT
jgi:hypothetical protein